MITRMLRLALACALMLPLLLVSCSDDKKSTTPGAEDNPPALQAPELVTTVDFSSTNENATQAQGMVNGLLGAANASVALGNAFFSGLESAQWGAKTGGCWTHSTAYQGCTYSWGVCEAGAQYNWSYMINGTCTGHTYTDWIVVSGTTNANGLTGTLHFYGLNSTTVEYSWTWTLAADRKSGAWSFYEGTETSGELQATLNWTKNTDNSHDIIWETTGSSRIKWTAHVAADGKSGTMQLREWDDSGAQYWLMYDIVWNADGTGSWIIYDEDGTVISETTWT